MVFQNGIFVGCCLIGYPWPDNPIWLPIEARTIEGWFIIQDNTVLVCPD